MNYNFYLGSAWVWIRHSVLEFGVIFPRLSFKMVGVQMTLRTSKPCAARVQVKRMNASEREFWN